MKGERKINVVIVDDERSSRETLQQLLAPYQANVTIVGEADSAAAGFELIQATRPDAVFLDVEMPLGTGFDLVKKLEHTNIRIIFITAHDKYAIHALKVSALDYLLKPIDKDELAEAVAKLQREEMQISRDMWDLLKEQLQNSKESPDRLAIASLQGYEIIKVKDIQYCEGDRNYTTFHLAGREAIIASKTLKEYEKLLPAAHFIRVHQKYLVNMNFVKRYLKGKGGTLVMSDGKSIEVSQAKKNDVIQALAK